jgi:sugar diacid utilization regulator
VATLAEIVAAPPLNEHLGWVVRPRADPVVGCVALIEDLAAVAGLPARSIVLITVAAAAATATYRFDVALRVARDRDVTALVVPAGAAAHLTPTSAAIADRSDTAILAMSDDADLAQLSAALAREIAGESDVALLRAHAAMHVVAAHPVDGTQEALLSHAGAALGVPITLMADEPSAGPSAPVGHDAGAPEGWLTAPAEAGDLGLAVEIVLRLTADRVRADLAGARRAEELPMESRAEALTELLAASPQSRDSLVQRARDLGVPVDGWHIGVRLDFQELADAVDDQSAWEARLTLGRSALRAARASGGIWHGARAGTAFALVRTFREEPGANGPANVAKQINAIVGDLREEPPSGTIVRYGVGNAHRGAAGLAESLAQAKAAVATARASGRLNREAINFDSVGLRRSLVEWYASDIAREAVSSVLAPLSELGGARAERLIQTLHVYLDQQGSLTKTAERLNLHRNAVAYRVDQIFDLLDVDPANADDLLLLQLACRARELA